MIAEGLVLLHSKEKPGESLETRFEGEESSPEAWKGIAEAGVAPGLVKLKRAYLLAQDCDRNKWDFAVELSVLQELGVAHEEIRWLVAKGFVEHAHEINGDSGRARVFDASGGFAINQRSCFVITPGGLKLTETFVDQGMNLRLSNDALAGVAVAEDVLPIWDDQRHELRAGQVLVKRFKWRAVNQEAILNAFQEDGWPPRIDDPIPPAPETDPKRRLSDAIKCLNRKQINPVLRFTGDGTGEGVVWNLERRAEGIAQLGRKT